MGLIKKLLATILVGMFVSISCTRLNDKIIFNDADTQNISAESAAEFFMLETTEISNAITFNVGDGALGTGFPDTLLFPAGSLTNWDKRLTCAQVSIIRDAPSTKENPQGTITIYYDSIAACVDTASVQRRGIIKIAYNGLRYNTNSWRALSYKSFSRNGVTINGMDTITNITVISSSSDTSAMAPIKFRHHLTGGKVTFTDNKKVYRNQDITVLWNRGATPAHDTYSILMGGQANGQTKERINYTMTILSDLVYSKPCALTDNVFAAIQGMKKLEIDTAAHFSYVIDYGSGACDNLVNVSAKGQSESVTMSPSGN